MQLSIKIDKEIYELLKKIKDRDSVPMSASLRRAVEKYAQEKGVMRNKFKSAFTSHNAVEEKI